MKNLLSLYYLPTVLLFLTFSSAELKAQDNEMFSSIQTDIEPEFVYEYEQTKFVPPKGKTLLVMGQTVERITEYMNHFELSEQINTRKLYKSLTLYH